ncbi:hypothetical protein VYU27_001958 [Nannochloropsis oceanica]
MAAGFLRALLDKGGHDEGGDDRLLVPLAFTGLCVLGATIYSTFYARPTSYPGGPRTHRQDRRASWTKRVTTLPAGWVFSHAEESHGVTQRHYQNMLGGEVPLTGEAAGRQMWYYDGKMAQALARVGKKNAEYSFSAAVNPNSADKVFRTQQISKWKGAMPDPKLRPKTAGEAARKGMSYYQMLQCEDGHWAGDYGGPMFLMPGLIFACYITKTPLGKEREEAMQAYLKNHQQEDGGWGLHIESPSSMFGTVMSYVSLRLLGLPASDPTCTAAHAFIQEHGGAVMAPSWCKFWLAVLGLHEWEGINSVPAEMWLLPRWFPFHPGRLWCHCRMVYLPMCYLYCRRFSADAAADPLLLALRHELYVTPYHDIAWDGERHACSDLDVYDPVSGLMKFLQNCLSYYERAPWLWLRKKGTDFAIAYIHAEDQQTNYVDIGPVNKTLNMLCVFAEGGKEAEAFKRHVGRLDDYLWLAEDGMKMQGYNGSQCWDTSFLVQAMADGGLVEAFPQAMRKAYSYLDRTQIKADEDEASYWFRHISKGGWPFSTAAHGWPIADCTAEGLKGVLALMDAPCVVEGGVPLIPPSRLEDAMHILLSYQNGDGGWATYENNRGWGWFELLNPSEVFGDIMIDYSYVELTSAVMTAMHKFNKRFPNHRSKEITRAIASGARFIRSIQRPDGSWYGSWGICFTYGTWFGIEGLIAAGEDPATSPSIRRALGFLLAHQQANGGWGESYLSCVDKAYPEDGTGQTLGEGGSGVVQTAWAVLGLLAGKCEDKEAMERGVRFLMAQQQEDGDWGQEGITGVFNRNCGITYSQYRNIFPLWALGRYAKEVEEKGR